MAFAIATAIGVSACATREHSRAADVSADDVRRLPPRRKAEVPDIMLSQSDRGRVLGGDSLSLPVYVISDYLCDSCRVWFTERLPAVRRAYADSGRVRITWVHYPLREHANAVRAASAAMCAAVQGRFLDASERLFASAAVWGTARNANPVIDSIGNVPGLDAFAYRSCVESGRLLRQIRSDIDWVDSQHAGNPLSVIVGTRAPLQNPTLATVSAAIDSALAERARR